jgi:hypothetical protein
MDNPKIIEPLAAVFHDAWIGSTKAIVMYLRNEGHAEAAGRLELALSSKWVPYYNLPEEKEKDRVWARKAVQMFQ